MIKTSKLKVEKLSNEKSFSLYNFDLKPLDLESYLDEYIVGQKSAKAIISTKICTHFQKIKYYVLNKTEKVDFIKNNILIIGPTGVGKTYMMKLIAKKVGVPFVKGDATKFSETGYVGGDIEDLIRELYWEAEGDLEKAHYGMIFLDEIDKIASAGETWGPDVSRTGVQRALLKPLEETTVEVKVPQDHNLTFDPGLVDKNKRKKITINTKYILFVASGAFHGLEEIIKKRLKKQNLGFLSEIETKDKIAVNYLKFVTPEDLVVYGFEREFVGRFPLIVVFDPLTEEDFFEILSNPNNPIVLNKKKDFKVYGIDIAFTDEAFKEIAKLAYKENIGARALSRILEQVLIPYERVFSSKASVNFLGITEELIKDPEGMLAAMLDSPENLRWKENYKKALTDEKKRVERYLNKKNLYRNENGEKFFLTPKRLELIFQTYKELDIELNKVLEEILFIWEQIKTYEKTFERRNNVKIVFAEDMVDNIIENVIKKDYGVFSYCERLMARFQYNLKYFKDILEDTPVLYVTSTVVKKPEKYLEEVTKNKIS